VEKARGTRTVLAYEDCDRLKDYDGIVRQVYIKNPNNQHPAILITNDFNLTMNQLIRKYSCRWLVETEIAEQIDFFHLNRNSSGIVIKVDFDLTMTILAHNLLRLFCKDIDGFAHCKSETLYDKFISAAGEVVVENDMVSVTLKKKRTLPHLLEHLHDSQDLPVPWLQNAALSFIAGSTT
jgi:hypothetical protein